MKKLIRNISALKSKDYDLIILGGGIFGACAAWDASLRGLSVLIVDKNDFANAASANHFKMVHGGIRYLQHGDIPRLRESSRERSSLLRIAPHLIRPLPIVIPTYGHGVKGKFFLSAGSMLYDLLTLDRNRDIQADRLIPGGRLITRSEVIKIFPALNEEGLTGGIIFHDGQVYSPPRLALSFIKSAVNKGAEAANYVEATGFLRKKNRIKGIKARDILSGDDLEIHGNWVLNTTGPWAHRLLEKGLDLKLNPLPTFSRDLAFVIKRRINHGYALAFSTRTKDTDSIVDIGGRRLFAVPWRDYTLIGVWHQVFMGAPERISVNGDEMQTIIGEVNAAYPGLDISLGDILMVNMGLTLFGNQNRQGSDKLSFGKRSVLIDHKRIHDVVGITTLIGVRATTARGMAEKAIDIILKRLGKKEIKSKTDYTPVYGGDIGNVGKLLERATNSYVSTFPPAVIKSLIFNYGSSFEKVIKFTEENINWKNQIGNSTITEAEVIHAIREEMAQKLSDIVFRRTDLCTGGFSDRKALRRVGELAANELGWDRVKMQKELNEVIQSFPVFSERERDK